MIRVTRLMQYDYPDAETMVRDMENWGAPASGVKSNGKITIRSTILPMELIEAEEWTEAGVPVFSGAGPCILCQRPTVGSVRGEPMCGECEDRMAAELRADQ